MYHKIVDGRSKRAGSDPIKQNFITKVTKVGDENDKVGFFIYFCL